jgi:general secretion pathway protein G
MNRRNHIRVRGFTLIELLLVLVILAVLAALVIPKFTNRSQQARETAAKTDISNIRTMIDAFEIDTGRFPATLSELLTQPANVQGWHGPYLNGALPKDPWGNEYVYKYPGQNNAGGYDLSSYGPDGHEGTDDIANWATK